MVYRIWSGLLVVELLDVVIVSNIVVANDPVNLISKLCYQFAYVKSSPIEDLIKL